MSIDWLEGLGKLTRFAPVLPHRQLLHSLHLHLDLQWTWPSPESSTQAGKEATLNSLSRPVTRAPEGKVESKVETTTDPCLHLISALGDCSEQGRLPEAEWRVDAGSRSVGFASLRRVNWVWGPGRDQGDFAEDLTLGQNVTTDRFRWGFAWIASERFWRRELRMERCALPEYSVGDLERVCGPESWPSVSRTGAVSLCLRGEGREG